MENIKVKESVVLIVISRILVFPFFVGISIIGVSVIFARWIVNYIRFGGEFIVYTNKMNRKTIADVFVMLEESQRK